MKGSKQRKVATTAVGVVALVAWVRRNKRIWERSGFSFDWRRLRSRSGANETPHGLRYEMAIYRDGAHPLKFASIVRGQVVETDHGQEMRPDGYIYPGKVGVNRWSRDELERSYGGDVLPRKSLLDLPDGIPT